MILLWFVPLFVLWADTCSFKTAEFTNKKGRIQKLCRMPAVALQCRNEVGENNFLLFLPWRKKDNEQHSLKTFRDLKGGHSTLGLNAHLSHQDREKSRNPCHCCENAEEEYWAQGASQWCKRSRRKGYRTGYCNKKWKGEQPGMLCRFCMDPSNRPLVESGTSAAPCMQWITLEDKVFLKTQAPLLIFGQTDEVAEALALPPSAEHFSDTQTGWELQLRFSRDRPLKSLQEGKRLLRFWPPRTLTMPGLPKRSWKGQRCCFHLYVLWNCMQTLGIA